MRESRMKKNVVVQPQSIGTHANTTMSIASHNPVLQKKFQLCYLLSYYFVSKREYDNGKGTTLFNGTGAGGAKMLRGLAAKKSGKTKKKWWNCWPKMFARPSKKGHDLKAIQEALGKASILRTALG